jgi:hypothetical protein
LYFLDGNLIHEFSKLVGEKTFSIVTNTLDKATQFGIFLGDATGVIVIEAASNIANLGLNWCLNKYEVNFIGFLKKLLCRMERRKIP